MSGRLGFQLLAEVSRSPFASYAELGRRLGVSGEAVRQRLGRWMDEGVLRGFSAIPAASVFGRQACNLLYPTSIDLDLLLRHPHVVYAVNTVDGRCGVRAYVEDVSAFADSMHDLVGEPPSQVGSAPAAARTLDILSAIDLRVLRALVADPRSSFRGLQDATGLSYRTVRARRQRLVHSGAVAVQPILRPSRSGDLYHNLWIQGPACADERTLLDRLGMDLVLDRWRSPPSLYLFCHQDGLEAHLALIESLRRTPGIDRVEVVMNKEYRFAEQRVIGWIDERLAAWRGRLPTGTA